jgi:Type IX secretion system protein PorV
MRSAFEESKYFIKTYNLYADMKKTHLSIAAFFLCLLFNQSIFAQCFDGFNPDGTRCGGTIQTAVPFLRIIPDARSGGMGDVGIALTPDANSILNNGSKLVMADKKWGMAVNYSAWLRNLGITDIHLWHGAGYYQFGEKKKQAIGFGVQYISLGAVNWTDFNGQPIGGVGGAYEMAFTGSYSRQLSEKWVTGLSAKYIHSNLATGVAIPTSSSVVQTGRALALDVSATYKKPIMFSDIETNLLLGVVVSNIGNKISYLRSSDFLPTNLGIGGAWEINFNKDNRLLFALDFNKLLVVTPIPNDTVDINGNKIPDWKEVSVVKGMFKSFNDAPNGSKEELEEITTSVGLEYWFKQHVALRAGYFHENKNKGGRQYYTIGGGVRYKTVGFNVSYLLPTQDQRTPLDNTWRFSLVLNGVSFKSS